MQALESTKNQIVDTQPILSDELVAVKNLIEYLEQNHQALAIRGSSTRFLETPKAMERADIHTGLLFLLDLIRLCWKHKLKSNCVRCVTI